MNARGGFESWNANDLTPVRLSDLHAYHAAGGDTGAGSDGRGDG